MPIIQSHSRQMQADLRVRGLQEYSVFQVGQGCQTEKPCHEKLQTNKQTKTFLNLPMVITSVISGAFWPPLSLLRSASMTVCLPYL